MHDGSRPAVREAARSDGAGGPWRTALAGPESAEQFGGGLVGGAEAGAERVAGDRLPVLALVLSGSSPCEREQRLVPRVLRMVRSSRLGRLAGAAVRAGDEAGAAGGAARRGARS